MKQDASGFYNLRGLYNNGLVHSYDLRDVIAVTPDLTFNPARTSGFNEIDVELPRFIKPVSPWGVMGHLNCLTVGFLLRLNEIPSTTEIWMGLSAGKDTRILLKLLVEFQAKGLFDPSHINFVAYEPEHVYAERILAECGFPIDNLHIFRLDQVHREDYYRLAEDSFNPNGCFAPEIEYFPPGFDYSDKVFIWGSCGNELTLYPGMKNHGRPFTNNLAQFLHYTYYLRSQHYEKYYKWGEVIEPFLYMPYMNAVFNLPPEAFVEYDGIRDRMLRDLGGTKIPCISGHRYNYNFTKATKTRIYDQFINSQFAARFDIVPYAVQLPNMIGQLKQVRTMEMDVLGLAMCYEGVDKHN